MRRESVDTYPPFPENISFLRWILGESGDSSIGLALVGRGKIAVISTNPEGFFGRILGDAADSRSGLIMGKFFASFY